MVQQRSTWGPWRAPSRAGGYPRHAVTLWKVYWQDLWPMGDPCWSSLLLRGCTLLEGTHTGAGSEELQPLGRTSSWRKDCLLWEGPHIGAVEECEEESFLWGERSGKNSVQWTNCSPCCPSPLHYWGEGVKKIGREAKPRKKERWGEGILWFSFYGSLYYSHLIGNIKLSLTLLVVEVPVTSDLALSLSCLLEVSLYSLPPGQLRSDKGAWWVPWHSVRITHHSSLFTNNIRSVKMKYRAVNLHGLSNWKN